MTATENAFVLPEQCNISAVENLYERLRDEQYAERIKLDGSHVTAADTAGVQLLVALQKRVAGHGGAIEWVAVSDALKRAATDLGLAELVRS
ncbi:MAG: STAS domain-containing protein [Hahellaceae bacterium]|nr:STAS domain-containing protein [Hahellaceae bacterium]